MVPEINWLAVVLATIAGMVVGAVWYARPVFGGYWMKAARVEPREANVWGPMLVALVVTFVSALVLAGAVAIAQEFYGGNFLGNSLLTAVILWAGFTAARFITHDAFEGRPWRLTLINVAHELAAFLVMALVIGLLGT